MIFPGRNIRMQPTILKMDVTLAFVVAHAVLLSPEDGMLVSLGLADYAPFSDRRIINDELFDELNEISLKEKFIKREISNHLKLLLHEKHQKENIWYDDEEALIVINNELGRIGMYKYVGNWKNNVEEVFDDLSFELHKLSKEISPIIPNTPELRYEKDDALRRYLGIKECIGAINVLHYLRE